MKMRKPGPAGLLNLLLFNLWAIASGITDWANHGGNLLNHRSASSRIGVDNVKRLQLQWKVEVGGDVTATPAIAAKEGVIYFPTFGGELYAMEAASGRVLWQRNLSLLVQGGMARATPALAGPRLLLSLLYPPVVMAFNRSSGALLWSSPRVHPHPLAIITMSGTVHKGFYYVGTSSIEEGVTDCCYFQGSISKIRVSNGEIIWQTSMLPDNGGRVGGYAGAGVWGSSPSIDKHRGLLFVATGNNYQVPTSVVQCQEQSEKGGDAETGGFTPDNCLDANNHAESIVAIEMESGKIVWSKHLGGYDVFSAVCSNSSTKPAQCASTLGPDYDFAQAPMVLYIPSSSSTSHPNTSCIVVAAQKSGIVWALDCSSGDIVWYKRAGPGSALGGSMWGSSTDRKHVFTAISNFYNLDFVLKSFHGNDTAITNGGGWVALDAATGDVNWAIANPAPNIDPNVTGGAPSFGPVSTSHGILWTTSFDANGHVYAIDSRNGSILWEYSTGATVYGGFSIGDSCVFVGNGYNASAAMGGTLGQHMFAFCLPL